MPENPDSRIPRIGAFVLETLTTGMYTNPLDTLREYVQNSFDAIRDAERDNLLSSGAGRIEISVDKEARNLTLRDNGTGIPVDDVHSRLVSIGMSSKSIQTDAGFRGIGRLAGIAYCKKLVFNTQANGETDTSSVTFDCDELRQAMSPRMKHVKELSDVIGSHATVTTEKTRKKDHFLEVRMEGINEAGQPFLEWKQINTYLCQAAPVGLDTQSFQHAGTIHQWLKDHNISVPMVSITISAGSLSGYQVYKPYLKLTYTTIQEKHKIHVKGIRFFPEDADPHSPFWGWYADTNCPGTFGDDTVGGFRLRKANIGIGMADRMTEIFAEAAESYARFNKYFMGEIHIQDPNVIPNARRDGFEDSSEWAAIRKSLIEFAHERSREAYQLSQARNLDIDRLVGAAEREREAAEKKTLTGLASKEEKGKVLEKIDRQIGKLEAAKRADRKDDERKEIDRAQRELQKTRHAVESETTFAAQNLNPSLDKKQRKIISEIIGILYHVLDEGPFGKARDAILAKYQIPDKEDER
jgi:molecular chaperone HtpG